MTYSISCSGTTSSGGSTDGAPGSGTDPNGLPDTGDNEYTTPNIPAPPCLGDPVPSPEIAPSGGWNVQGGRFGFTRSNGNQFHDGTDIKAEPNTNVYSMLNGTVVDTRSSFAPGEYRSRSYGNYVTIESTLASGETVRLKYNHLNSVGVQNETVVESGNLIGKSGNTGNAQTRNGVPVISHIHIQAKTLNNGEWEKANPEDFMSTKFDANGNSMGSPCD